jgi:hypothetical protein
MRYETHVYSKATFNRKYSTREMGNERGRLWDDAFHTSFDPY